MGLYTYTSFTCIIAKGIALNFMKVYLGADHRGFELKEKIKIFLIKEGHEVEDMGNNILDKDDDYPDFVIPVAKKVSQNPEKSKGIILGYSGQGEAIAANRINGVRAVVYYGGERSIISLSREHNNANVLSLGAGFLNEEEAKEVVKEWLNTPFSEEERHKRRINQIKELENHG